MFITNVRVLNTKVVSGNGLYVGRHPSIDYGRVIQLLA